MRISFSGLVLLIGLMALSIVVRANFAGFMFLSLAEFWTAGCLFFGGALLLAVSLRRFAKRNAKPS